MGTSHLPACAERARKTGLAPLWWVWVERGFDSKEAADFADQVKVSAGRTRGQKGVRSPRCPRWRKSEGNGSCWKGGCLDVGQGSRKQRIGPAGDKFSQLYNPVSPGLRAGRAVAKIPLGNSFYVKFSLINCLYRINENILLYILKVIFYSIGYTLTDSKFKGFKISNFSYLTYKQTNLLMLPTEKQQGH